MKKLLALLFALLASPAAAQTIPSGPNGSINYWGVGGLSQVLNPGLAGQCLQTQGVGSAPVWVACPGSSLSLLPPINTNQFYGNVSGQFGPPGGVDVNTILNTVGYDIARPPPVESILYKSNVGPTFNWQALPPAPQGSILTSGGPTNPPFWSPTPTQSNLASICTIIGAIMYFDTPSSLWKCLAPGTSGQLLQTGGASGNPSWLTVTLATLGGVPSTRNINTSAPLGGGGALSADLTLTCATCATLTDPQTLANKTLTLPVLSVANPTAAGALGYTGASQITYGDGSSTRVVVSLDQAQTLISKTINGASNTLTVRLANDVTGNLPVANLNSGTGAAASTFWRGDGTWVVPPGTGVTSVGPGYGIVTSPNPIVATGTAAVSLTSLTGSTGADVLLNNTANYFDGPGVVQGTSGTWFASATVTVTDSAAANVNCKLWDGTTVMASANGSIALAGAFVSITLSGLITAPAGNIKVSCRDINNTTGKIVFNFTGNSKDSTTTAFRIQ